MPHEMRRHFLPPVKTPDDTGRIRNRPTLISTMPEQRKKKKEEPPEQQEPLARQLAPKQRRSDRNHRAIQRSTSLLADNLDRRRVVHKKNEATLGRANATPEDAYVGMRVSRGEQRPQSEAVQSDENDGEVRLKTDTEGEMTCRSRPPELTGRMKAIEREKRFYER